MISNRVNCPAPEVSETWKASHITVVRKEVA